ncbi:MAG: glycosyltransferase family 4 protein, partial [Rhodospirillaceae bacterium]|nr:glycosyltransferase family 4 protein [Rhodospirillaceae bacterium]
NPAALYEAADLVVCPSRIEPLGNVVLEAWARQRPIVAAAAQGPVELIRDGENGLLVPMEDVDAMAAAINRILSDPDTARNLVRAGYDNYSASYSEAVVVRRYLDFFDAVIG